MLDVDLFSPDSLRDPFDDYRRLRDAGPVVRPHRPDAYAIGRFADVQAALRACFMSTLSKETVRDGSWAGELFAAARSGRLSMAEASAAISAYVIRSLDTAILAKGHLLANLARKPEQWAMLRERPELIPSAVLEGVRSDAVIR